MELNGSTKNHSKLKHLGFDESGHTGFQKELTPEQLSKIAAVPDWSQPDETQPDYIKGRTHYIKRTEVGITLVAQDPYEIEDENGNPAYICGLYGASEPYDLSVIGTVYIDGEKYDASGYTIGIQDGDYISWGADSYDEDGNPVTWGYMTNGAMREEPVDYPDIYIYWYEYEVVPLDDKYIPDTIARKSAVDEALENIKGRCIVGDGEPSDELATANGLLYFDKNSSPPTVYLSVRNDESGECYWYCLDSIAREAYDLLYLLAADVWDENGFIATDYQNKHNRVETLDLDNPGQYKGTELYPSAYATCNAINSSIQQAILDSWEVAV